MVGQKIKELREKKGLSGKELAALVGVSQAHISAIEKNDRGPSRELTKKIAQVLETSMDYLLNDDSNPLDDIKPAIIKLISSSEKLLPRIYKLINESPQYKAILGEVPFEEWLDNYMYAAQNYEITPDELAELKLYFHMSKNLDIDLMGVIHNTISQANPFDLRRVLGAYNMINKFAESATDEDLAVTKSVLENCQKLVDKEIENRNSDS